MDLLTTLVLGSYGFTAGAYIFAWKVYRIVSNHQTTRLEKLERRLAHLEGSCQPNCESCIEEGL